MYFLFSGRLLGRNTTSFSYLGAPATRTFSLDMALGRKLRNLGNWPALRLKAVIERCINCQRCTQACPMSLDVNGMVQRGVMEHSECILCGSCVDTCPKKAIGYSFSKGK